MATSDDKSAAIRKLMPSINKILQSLSAGSTHLVSKVSADEVIGFFTAVDKLGFN